MSVQIEEKPQSFQELETETLNFKSCRPQSKSCGQAAIEYQSQPLIPQRSLTEELHEKKALSLTASRDKREISYSCKGDSFENGQTGIVKSSISDMSQYSKKRQVTVWPHGAEFSLNSFSNNTVGVSDVHNPFGRWKEDFHLYSSTLCYGEKSLIGNRTQMEDRIALQNALLTLRIDDTHESYILPPALKESLHGIAENSKKSALNYPFNASSSSPLKSLHQFHFAGVFDGHGGAEIAEALEKDLSVCISDAFRNASCDSTLSCDVATLLPVDSLAANDGLAHNRNDDDTKYVSLLGTDQKQMRAMTLVDIEETIKKAFSTMNGSIHETRNKIMGSTAVVSLIGALHLIVANVGDSRAVLSRGKQAYRLSRDHKPFEIDEEERIRQAGGDIHYFNGYRVMGLLAMTRAFGDNPLRNYGISADPEVTILPRSEDDDFLILACDGVWDVMSDDEACRLVHRCFNRAAERNAARVCACDVAASVLAKAAITKGSNDNVSVVIIDLQNTRSTL